MRFNLLDLLLPREMKFFDYFEQQIDTLIEGCTVFQALLKNIATEDESTIRSKLAQIKKCEEQGDIIERAIIDELHKTFITPLDREDIHLMTINIDKSLDILTSISRKIEIYRIRYVPENVCRFTDVIMEIASESKNLIHYLKEKESVSPIVQKMHTLENKADDLFHISMAELFNDSFQVTDIIKFKEIYEHLESIVDSIDFIGKIVRGIVVKQG